MELKLSTTGDVSKNMKTSRNKKEGQIVTCGIAIKAVRVNREAAAALAGVPIETVMHMFDELGAPFQRMSFLMPKRVLRASGKLELRGDSGAAVATLNIGLAAAGDFRFNLDVPDDQGPTVMSSFTLLWKAHGDEVEDLGPLLDNNCFVTLDFTDENTTKELFPSSPASPTLEAAAGHRAKLDRKRQAAGEKPEDNDAGEDVLLSRAIEMVKKEEVKPSASAVQRALKIGYNRAARLLEAMEVLKIVTPMKADGSREYIDQVGVGGSEIAPAPGNLATATAAATAMNVTDIGKARKKVTNLAQLEREAKEHAKKHPRRDPPRPPNNKGKR